VTAETSLLDLIDASGGATVAGWIPPYSYPTIGRYRIVKATNATLQSSAVAPTSVSHPLVLRVHEVIDRHGVTLNTGLILVLAFLVAIHCPDHGVAAIRLHGR